MTVRRTSDGTAARLVGADPAGRRRPPATGLALTLTGVGLVALTACGSNSATTGQDALPTGPGTTTAAPTPTPENLVPQRPPKKQDGVVSIQGTVSAGVEAGCLVLSNAGGQYALIGAAVTPDVIGQEVIVTGTAAEDLATTCQQGTPFNVTQVLRR
ncbi:MAG: hypothetical protein JWL64_1802 [Frankiales bacterium]|nr:hypothetical protein [Frankiales bacterium]